MTMQLLLVDDSALIRVSLSDLLSSIDGLDTISTATTLAEAIESVRSNKPTFAIVDLHLPDGNAADALGTMKQLAPDMQIAVLTNDASAFNRKRCMRSGADWFFDKSTEFEEVIELVRTQAASRRASVDQRKVQP